MTRTEYAARRDQLGRSYSAGEFPAHELQERLSALELAAGPIGDRTWHLASCGSCAWRPRSATSSAAREHEETGHRVTVWDSPSSQIPRDWWTRETAPSPVLAA